MANKANTLREISEITKPGPKGIKAQEIKAVIRLIIGANKNKALFECAGKTASFTNNFSASAT
jgi:hypothetical protein